MDQSRFQEIDALLDELLDAPADRRGALLDERCAGDAELRAETLKLLAAVDESAEFIEAPEFVRLGELLEDASPDRLAGRKVGAYKLEGMLGRGGMGVVYKAVRIDDFRKEVAVKFIPQFESRRGAAADFRREREILARLSHPNIAQILDGGTTEDGSPYLVMEFVDGLPLDEFCRSGHLDVRARLRLFTDVCAAVGFAHRNLVVHRDLKPNNILVDTEGNPKLLDFGIAKLLADDVSDGKPRTVENAALTPEYASPEQLAGEPITTASDVYSLGVVLYEVLTGRRPHDLAGRGIAEIIAIVRGKQAAPPSASITERGSPNPAELDAVVLKALSNAPAERYQSVEDFRADIVNLLADQPVSARPHTGFYRVRKYIKRNRFEVTISAVFALIVLGWLLTSLYQAREAARQSAENRRSAYSAEMILAANEYENANLNRLRQLVEKYEPREGEEDLRGFEWFYLNGLLSPSTLVGGFRHPDEVWNAEFSPDGTHIASACNDNKVRIWNVADGSVVETEDQKGAWKVSYFPDGRRVAAAGSSNSAPTVRIYEASTGRAVLTFTGHAKRVRAVDVAPDGRMVASGSQDGTVKLWSAETGEVARTWDFALPGRGTEVLDVLFARDGKRLFVLGFERLAIIDIASGAIRQINPAEFAERGLVLNGWKQALSPLEKTLALGLFSGELIFVDVDTLKVLRVVKLHQANLKSLAFTSDGRTLATGSGDRTIKFVDVGSGEVTGELRGHFSGVHEVMFSPDGKLMASAAADFELRFWDADAVLRGNALLTGGSTFAFDRAGARLYAWRASTLETTAWDIGGKSAKYAVRGVASAFAADISRDEKRVYIAERDGYLSVIDFATGAPLNRWKVSPTTAYAIGSAPDDQTIFLSTEDGRCMRIDADNGSARFDIKVSDEILKSLAVSADGRFVAVAGNDRAVRLMDASDGHLVATFDGNQKPILKLLFSDDGKLLLSAGADDTVRAWRLSDGLLVRQFSGMSAGVTTITFSPDGKRLATASDVGVVRLWNFETGEQVLAFTASQKVVTQLRFTADGKSLVTVDAVGKLATWNAPGR